MSKNARHLAALLILALLSATSAARADGVLHPAFVLLVGALLVGPCRGHLRTAVLFIAPLATLWAVWQIPDGVAATASFLGYEIQPIEGGAVRLAPEGWETLPAPLARRLLRRAWHGLGGGRDVSRRHLDRALAFLVAAAPGARIELPGHLVLRRDAGGFLFARAERSAGGGGPRGS